MLKQLIISVFPQHAVGSRKSCCRRWSVASLGCRGSRRAPAGGQISQPEAGQPARVLCSHAARPVPAPQQEPPWQEPTQRWAAAGCAPWFPERAGQSSESSSRRQRPAAPRCHLPSARCVLHMLVCRLPIHLLQGLQSLLTSACPPGSNTLPAGRQCHPMLHGWDALLVPALLRTPCSPGRCSLQFANSH